MRLCEKCTIENLGTQRVRAWVREREPQREKKGKERICETLNFTTQTPHIRAKKKQLAVKNTHTHTHTHKNTKKKKNKTKQNKIITKSTL